MRLLIFSLVFVVAVFSISEGKVLYLHPETESGNAGQNFTFTCKARLETPAGALPKIVWTKDYLVVPDDSGKFIVQSTLNMTDRSALSVLTVINAREKESGTYECKEMGVVASLTAKLDVFKNFEYSVFPYKNWGPTGKNYTFTCKAKIDDEPIPSLSWKRNSQVISNKTDKYVVKLTQNITENSAESTLTIVNGQEEDNGVYACIHDVKDIYGTFVGVLDLYKEYVPIIKGDRVLKEGANLSYTCDVEGSTHPVQWRKNDVDLPTTGSVDLDSDGKVDVEVTENQTLVILEASTSDAGDYTCIYNDGDKSFQNYINVKERANKDAGGAASLIWPSVTVSLLSLVLTAIV